jgi:hypothetical protein
MHPHTFVSTLFDHETRDEVFVIMSFAPEFDDRWQRVIEPAVREELKLAPNRVDYSVSGESVVYDILDGIAHARLILADITSSPMTDRRGAVWPQRNGNVMWELGIAHVMRLPDEVLVVRSDSDPSLFDLTQFRAFQYNPSEADEARRVLVTLAQDRLHAVDRAKSDFVRRCAHALDPISVKFLLNRVPYDGRVFTIEPSMDNAMSCPRLFELGILRTESVGLVTNPEDKKPRTVPYSRITPLGQCVLKLIAQRMGVWEKLGFALESPGGPPTPSKD